MSKVEDFLSPTEEQEIIVAINKAEKNTSGEIRVHIEPSSEKDHFERAIEVFYLLEMNTTKLQNAVLIYVAVNDKKFVIYGDKGIDKVVSKDFWDGTKETIQHQFKNENFTKGIIEGVLQVGLELKTHFPFQKDDIDELSNEISKG